MPGCEAAAAAGAVASSQQSRGTKSRLTGTVPVIDWMRRLTYDRIIRVSSMEPDSNRSGGSTEPLQALLHCRRVTAGTIRT
ncbi:hypothetical protein ACSS6W_006568 [Trichoderma asperelloides]